MSQTGSLYILLLIYDCSSITSVFFIRMMVMMKKNKDENDDIIDDDGQWVADNILPSPP